MTVLLRALLWYLAAFGAAIAVYLVASWLLMRGHAPAREATRALRAIGRELATAALVQPLLPLFYLPPARLGRGRGKVPVVLVHGYGQNRVDFLALAFVLSRSGAGGLHGFNYPWLASVRSNARRLGRFVERVCEREGCAQLDLVCHSIGGLVALEYLRTHGAARVRRCVTIASPHAGVAYRGPLPGACAKEIRAGSPFLAGLAAAPLRVPVLSIYSTHDNIVFPSATSSLAARGGTDLVVGDCGHLAILFDEATTRAVAGFLQREAIELPPAAAA